jgi:signal peptidase I
MPTVQKLARELGLTSQEVMTRLKALGRPADGHLSQVEDQVADRLRRDTRGPSAPRDASADGGASKTGATEEARAGEGASTAAATARTPDKTASDGSPSAAVEDRRPGSDGEAAPTRAGKAREGAAGDKAAGGAGPAAVPAGEQGKATGLLGRFKRGRADKPGPRVKAGKKPAPPKPKGARSKWLKRVAELPVLILVAFLVAVVIKMFLVQAFFIPSGSMRPTLRGGDRVLVEKVSYLIGGPNQGDVIVFTGPDAAGKPRNQDWYDDVRNFMRQLLGLPTPGTTDYIKRVAAVGGDTIRYDGNPRVLTVNGKRVKEPYVRRPDGGSLAITPDTCAGMELRPAPDGCRVPAGTVFVLGDNRGSSQDSRFLGPIKEEDIIGRAFVVIWPLDDFSGL